MKSKAGFTSIELLMCVLMLCTVTIVGAIVYSFIHFLMGV